MARKCGLGRLSVTGLGRKSPVELLNFGIEVIGVVYCFLVCFVGDEIAFFYWNEVCIFYDYRGFDKYDDEFVTTTLIEEIITKFTERLHKSMNSFKSHAEIPTCIILYD